MIFCDFDDLDTVTFRRCRLEYSDLFLLLRMERLRDVGIKDYMVNVPSIHYVPHCFGRAGKAEVYLEASPVVHD